ncbi:hypothetical protein ACH5RR_038661 [Cinchona calisaya]|uniref:SHSP domain-containing protein n=1 Tax=Cinchona calisaya TaxID=153742 RepID=A0ABD2XX96_9GENT
MRPISTGSQPFSIIIINNASPPALLSSAATFAIPPPIYPESAAGPPPHYYNFPPQHDQSAHVIRNEHPFLKWGNPNLFELKSDEEKTRVRVDMPGINREGLKVWFENGFLKIVGQQQKEDEDVHHHHQDGAHEMMKGEARVYDVTVDLLQEDEILKKEETLAELKNGILNIIVPKIKLQEIKDIVNVTIA